MRACRWSSAFRQCGCSSVLEHLLQEGSSSDLHHLFLALYTTFLIPIFSLFLSLPSFFYFSVYHLFFLLLILLVFPILIVVLFVVALSRNIVISFLS